MILSVTTNVSHCLSSLWPEINYRMRHRISISRDFSWADNILPTCPELEWLEMAQSSISVTTQDVEREGLSSTTDRQWPNKQVLSMQVIHSSFPLTGQIDMDTIEEHVDLGINESGIAAIAVKVTAERILPVDQEKNLWRKSSVTVTRTIEIDLMRCEETRVLYEKILKGRDLTHLRVTPAIPVCSVLFSCIK